MQEIDTFGRYGPPKPFNEIEMLHRLSCDEVDHIEVFMNTPEEMERRRKLASSTNPVNKKAKKKRNKMRRQSRKNSR